MSKGRRVLVNSAAMGSESRGEHPAKLLTLQRMEDMLAVETEWSKRVLSNAILRASWV